MIGQNFRNYCIHWEVSPPPQPFYFHPHDQWANFRMGKIFIKSGETHFFLNQDETSKWWFCWELQLFQSHIQRPEKAVSPRQQGLMEEKNALGTCKNSDNIQIQLKPENFQSLFPFLSIYPLSTLCFIMLLNNIQTWALA